jgi:hypothetical protein
MYAIYSIQPMQSKASVSYMCRLIAEKDETAVLTYRSGIASRRIDVTCCDLQDHIVGMYVPYRRATVVLTNIEQLAMSFFSVSSASR